MSWRVFFVAVFVAVISISSAHAAQKINVVTTIKPLHSLLASLMNGVGEPTLLMKDVTPYDYKPSPTDLKTIKKADLVVWMGPELETSISKEIQAHKNSLEMLAHPDFKVLPKRKDDNARDPFMWLDVRNAEVFVDELYKSLSKIDPDNMEAYKTNRDLLKRDVAGLDRQFEFGFRAIAAGLSWVYHDTQQYFEQSYAFKVRDILAKETGDVADTMKLLKARDDLVNTGPICFFVEEGMKKDNLFMAVDGTKAKVETLDSFAMKLKAGPDLYIKMMQHNYDTIANCFKSIGAKYTGPTVGKTKQ